MNQQRDWQCLTLATFFERCNWQGQPSEVSLSQLPEEVSALSIAQVASVLSFDQADWQRLTVRDFFGCSNWLGQLQPPDPVSVARESHASLPSPLPEPLNALTPSVQVFFQSIPWEGQPEIAALPKLDTSFPVLSDTRSITLTDLSNLF